MEQIEAEALNAAIRWRMARSVDLNDRRADVQRGVLRGLCRALSILSGKPLTVIEEGFIKKAYNPRTYE